MALELKLDEHGRLGCELGGRTVTAFDAAASVAAMIEALDSVDAEGVGDCLWEQATGLYRWVFRKQGAQAKVVVMWSTGVITGWEHVWWGDVDWQVFSSEIRGQLARIQSELATRPL